MTPLGWLVGWAILLVQVGALILASRGLQQRLLPRWQGPPAVLAGSILFVTLLVGTGQVLGVVGWFDRWAMLVLALVLALLLRPSRGGADAGPGDGEATDRDEAGGAAGAAVAGDAGEGAVPGTGGRTGAAQALLAPTDRWGWSTRAAVASALLLLVSTWAARVLAIVRLGQADGDSLMYHLPFATRFVQTGSVTEVANIGPDPWVTFYPANVELIQAAAMLPVQHQALVPLVSLAWLGLTLLAAWCLGAVRGHGPLALLLAGVTVALPIMTATNAGSGRVDVATMAFVLAAAAMLLQEPRTVASTAVAGLALGLAIGTKFAVLPAAGLLLLAAGAVLWRRHGHRHVAAWVGAAALPGALWLVRNWAVAGNPLPMMDLRLGPVGFAALDDERLERLESGSLFDQLTSSDSIAGEALLPAVEFAFGPWPLALALLVVGAAGVGLLARRGSPGMSRALAIAAVGGTVAYVFSPNTAPIEGFDAGLQDMAAAIIGLNARYLTPGLILLVCMLPLGLAPHHRRAASVLGWGAVAGIGYYTLHPAVTSGLWVNYSEWPVDAKDYLAVGAAGGALVGVALLVELLGRRTGRARATEVGTSGDPAPRPPRGLAARTAMSGAGAAGALGLAGLVAGTWVAVDQRSMNVHAAAPSGLAALWHGAHGEPEGQHIAVIGEWQQQGLARDDLGNEVEYLGIPQGEGLYRRPGDCEAFREALAAGSYDLAVVQEGQLVNWEVADEERWLAELPGSVPLVRTGAGVLFRLPDDIDPTCRSAGAESA